MSSDQTARIIFLSIIGFAVLATYLTQTRLKKSQVAQQAMIWVLIFVGVIGGVGLWQDMKSDFFPTQSYIGNGQIEVPRGPDNHFHLTVEVNGTDVQFLVDTGATNIVLNQRDARRVGLDAENLAYIHTARTANGEVRTAPVRLDTMRLGEIKDFDVRASVNGGELDSSLLGMDYLSRFNSVTIEGNRLILTR